MGISPSPPLLPPPRVYGPTIDSRCFMPHCNPSLSPCAPPGPSPPPPPAMATTGLFDSGTRGAESFYKASVWSRLFLVSAFLVLVVFHGAPKGLAVLAAINLVGAVTMHVQLGKSTGAGTAL